MLYIPPHPDTIHLWTNFRDTLTLLFQPPFEMIKMIKNYRDAI